MKKQAVPVPGAILKESFIDEYNLSVAKISKDIGLSPSAIRQIIKNTLPIRLETAWKLSKYFNTTVEYWVDLQTNYDIDRMRTDAEFMDRIKLIPKAKKVPEAAPAREPRKAKAAAQEVKPRRGRGPGKKKAAAVKLDGMVKIEEPAKIDEPAAEKKTRKPRARKVSVAAE